MKLHISRWQVRVLLLLAAVVAFPFWYFADDGYSNIYPRDYVGPSACRECHEDNHDENFELWQGHSHRVMNQNPDEATVRGDFSGREIRYWRGHATFHRDGSDFLMSIYEGDRLVRRHKVTRTVGSLYLQYYIGTQVEGPEPKNHPAYGIEGKLPFAYSFALKRWLPEIYLDSEPATTERDYLDGRVPDYIYEPPTHSWNLTCMNCHNTYPYVTRLWRQSGPWNWWRAGFPADSVDWRGTSRHQGALKIGPYQAGGFARALPAEDLVTVGISCESCHFGGREHAVEGKEIRFVPTAPELAIHRPGSEELVASDRDDPFVVNSICAQCHNADLDRYPNSAPSVNSEEATALTSGACSSRIKCTDCHDPHEAGARSGSADRPGYIEACLSCHPHFEDPAARSRHAQHSDQVTCLDCHMPRIVAGLDTVVRSHFISSPGDAAMLRTGSPNACNLCHLDRSISWTLGELEERWDLEVLDRRQLWKWFGPDRDAPLGTVWLRSPDRFTRLAATEAYARSPLIDDPIPFMLESLKDEYDFNRTFGLIAIERVLKRPIREEEYDLLAEPALREEQVGRLAESLLVPTPPLHSAGGRVAAQPGS